jgi:hypothetical protein
MSQTQDLSTSSSISAEKGDAALFPSLTEELLLQVAEFLPAEDVLRFQSVSKETNQLNTDKLWKKLCETRWNPWPRYRLTEARGKDLDEQMPNTSWKDRYMAIEQDATRTELRESDLHNLRWYLCFVLSGIRGEGRSDHMPVRFLPCNIVMVPQYPPLTYQIIQETPPSSSHIRSTLRGDQPFSNHQWLQISHFPPHFVTRKQADAEWLIVNENVMMVSCKKD